MIHHKLLKSIFLAMLLSASALTASAYNFMVDDLAYVYNNDGTSVTVTSGGNYSGDIIIPESVTYNGTTYTVISIGNGAFYNCSGLTSVTIPNSVTSIASSAFYHCSGLTSVHITDLAAWCNIAFGSSTSNPLYYAHHLFLNGTEVNDLVIPNSVTSIGDNVFSGCSGLTSVTIPNSVISIGNGAFYSCSGLTSVTIPNSVTSIGSYAFYGCSGLTSVTIPNSVTSIGSYAFYGCSGLTSINIPNSVTSIGSLAFYGCANLTSVAIPNSVISIGSSAFSSCSGLTNVSIPNSVTTIGGNAFNGCSSLTSVTIPNSVTSIGDNPFSGCIGLESIAVDNGNSTYDSRDNCNAIIETATNTLITGCKNTVIPNSVTSIGNRAFGGCSGLTSVTIGNSVTSIGNSAFSGCSGLTSVTIGNSVTSIGFGAFYGCSGLASVTIPNSVTSIGESAFYNCSGLTTVNWNAKSCADCSSRSPFNGLTGITSFNFGNEVEHIPAYLCCGLSGLITITIPNSVTTIGGAAFQNCSGLTNITLTGYGSWIYNSYNMPGLRDIIGQLKNVSIGSGITSLGGFNFNPNVVNCYAEVPPTCSSSTFANYDGALHVPTTATVAYMTAEYWQNFTNLNIDIIEKITLSQTEAALTQHEELQLTATVSSSVQNDEVLWCSTNAAVASVDNSGKVTATGQGDCYIHATLASNPAVYTRCHITASYPEITSLTLSETELVFNQIGDTITLITTAVPDDTGVKPIWTSSDEAVATVNANGLVTAINLGECDITATVLNQSATCHVTVTSAIIITLDMASATIAPNEILTLTPSFNPTETDIVATSSDASVAFARAITQNGVKKVQVAGLAEGTATITVASVDGKAIPATCVVTVSNAPSVIMGDANGDGNVNVSDYVYVANYILEQNPEPFVFAAADIDGNGEINVSDLVLVANIALTYEDPNTLNAPAPKATLNADIDMNATLHKNADGTTSITVDLNNSMDLTALQMDISLPQGMAVTGATLTDRATRSHQAEVAQLANGNYRLLAASSASKAFKGNEGALLTLTLSDEPQGTVTLGGIKLASPDGQCFTVNDMLLAPIVTGIDDITAQARIYGEAGSIVIESPVNGTAQLVLPNGMSRTVKVKAGRNIYPAPATGLVIVHMNATIAKLLF